LPIYLASRTFVQGAGVAGVFNQGTQRIDVIASSASTIYRCFTSLAHQNIGHVVNPLEKRAENPDEAASRDSDDLQRRFRVRNSPRLRSHLTDDQVQEGHDKQRDDE